MPAAIPLAIAGSAIGGLASSAIGAGAAGHAADTQAAAANNAAALQKQAADQALAFQKLQYGNSLSLLSPYYNSGTSALNQLDFLMGLKPSQGLPQGVVNPNAPAATGTAGFSRPNLSDFTGDALLPAGGRGAGAGNPIVGNAFSAMPRFQQLRAAQADPTAQVPQTGTPGAGTTGGFQNPDTLPGSWPGLNGTTAPGATVANGLPGTVPRTDGGGAATGAPGAQDASGGNSFGSLAKSWDQTFQAPTDVTEQNDPGYQFRLKQGQQIMENSAAARGGLLSGGTAKALTDFGQNDASNEYQNTYNRALQTYNTNFNSFTNNQSNQFNKFATLAGLGQSSANDLSAAGLNTGNAVGNTLLTSAGQIGNQLNNAGAATASGYVGGANAITGGINSAMNSLQLLALLNKNGGAGAGGLGV